MAYATSSSIIYNQPFGCGAIWPLPEYNSGNSFLYLRKFRSMKMIDDVAPPTKPPPAKESLWGLVPFAGSGNSSNPSSNISTWERGREEPNQQMRATCVPPCNNTPKTIQK
eukprot:2350996-Pleurochrysis_carterae.AAC.2